MIRFVACIALLAALSGCSKPAERPASTLSEAQRDTVLSHSEIPGASAVGRAMDVAGTEAGHAAALDSLAR